MTTKQLNADIKKLVAYIKRFQESNESRPASAYENQMKIITSEFERLYGADREFEYINAASIKALITINRKYRIIPFHSFGPTDL